MLTSYASSRTVGEIAVLLDRCGGGLKLASPYEFGNSSHPEAIQWVVALWIQRVGSISVTRKSEQNRVIECYKPEDTENMR